MSRVINSSAAIQDHDIFGEKANVIHDESPPLQLSEEELVIQTKLLRRIDWLVMPLVVSIYLFNYIDRNNYAAAKLQGMQKDLHLTGPQYHLGLGILFVGYIVASIPSNQVLNYSGRPSLYLGAFTVAWGCVSALTCLVKNYAGILACRLLLGVVEAPFFPGVLFYLSKWYTRAELNMRMSLFYMGALIAGAVGNLIAAGILHGLAGKSGLAGWQWLYIVEGVITVGLGIAVMLVLPDFPQNWKWLTPEMKHVASRRMTIEAAQADVDESGGMSHVKGFFLAMKDFRVHVLALAYMSHGVAGGFQFVFPTLTQTLGYNNTVSLLLCAPPYFFVAIWSVVHSWISDRRNKRFFFVVYLMPLVLAGYAIFMSSTNFTARYISLFLMTLVFCINGTFFAWVATAIPSPPAKRAAAYAYVNALGNSASAWTSFTYPDSNQPYYRIGFGLSIGMLLSLLLCSVYLYCDMKRANERLARMENEDVPLSAADLAALQKTAEVEGVDLATARRTQKGYRYVL